MSLRFRSYAGIDRQRFEHKLPTRELAIIRIRLLRIDAILAGLELEGGYISEEGAPSNVDWLMYLEEYKVIPIYDDAIAVMRYETLVEPKEVFNILSFLSVGGSSYGIDKAENHGYGYHFHFGRRGRTLLRGKTLFLLLTVDYHHRHHMIRYSLRSTALAVIIISIFLLLAKM